MSKATLLVVEDEPNLLLGIRDILELDGYTVLTAHDGHEALQLLEERGEQVPDLIVSDIMMPNMDGIAFLKEVRKKEKWLTIPFIFLTAKGGKADLQQGKMLGVDDYLVKPFDADDLLVAVRAKLHRHRALHEAQASAISAVKRNILTILNHEFRTPLTLVVAYADMLKEGNVEAMGENELLTFLREINSGADRLRRLIENFILLVELETGDAEKTFEWRKERIQDVEVLLQEVISRAKQNDTNDAQYQLQVAEELPDIVGDREYLHTLVNELVNNAVKFSPEDQPVRIEAEPNGSGELYIRVTDYGRGIPADQLDEIWDVFYQINREKYEDQGAGSGLAIVKRLADLHDARVHVESEEQAYTCFTVVFPSAD